MVTVDTVEFCRGQLYTHINGSDRAYDFFNQDTVPDRRSFIIGMDTNMAQNTDQTSPAQALVPFTGFYTLDANKGSFVMVDTKVISSVLAGGAPTSDYFATITICSDGQTPEQFPLEGCCTFDGTHLVITDGGGRTIANLDFTNNGGASMVAGVIYGTKVAGSTPFGPVPLSLWNGTYYAQGQAIVHGGQKNYPYVATLRVNPDGTVEFALNGDSLEPVQYSYDFGMFVIGLEVGSSSKPMLFEMGTVTGWGRVAGNAKHGNMLVSICLQQPVPTL